MWLWWGFVGDFLEEKLHGWLIKGLVEVISTKTLLKIKCIRILSFGVGFCVSSYIIPYWSLLVPIRNSRYTDLGG